MSKGSLQGVEDVVETPRVAAKGLHCVCHYFIKQAELRASIMKSANVSAATAAAAAAPPELFGCA